VGKPEYGITPESYHYIGEGDCTVAIEVTNPRCYAEPVKLDEIRRIIGSEKWALRGPVRVKPGEKLYDVVMEARSRGYVDCRSIEACKQVA